MEKITEKGKVKKKYNLLNSAEMEQIKSDKKLLKKLKAGHEQAIEMRGKFIK